VVRAKAGAVRGLLEDGLVDVLFANEEEAAALGVAWGGGGGGEGRAPPATAPLDLEAAALAGQRLAVEHARVAAVVSLGARGARALWWEEGGEGRTLRCHTSPAPCVAVKDTVGAGDAFAAGFLVGLLSGQGVAKALEAGCGAGAAAVGVDGADAGERALREVGRRVLGCAGGGGGGLCSSG
jgi:sugar/nucleoside kinase (ribokinase family)